MKYSIPTIILVEADSPVKAEEALAELLERSQEKAELVDFAFEDEPQEVKVPARIGSVRINISCSSAAFDLNPEPELVRVLRRLADDIKAVGIHRVDALRDSNGSFVGELVITTTGE